MKQWFFEKIHKIHKPLVRLIKKKIVRAQINKIRNEKLVISDSTGTQKIMSNYYNQLYASKLDNLEEMKILSEVQSSKTEPGRNRKYQQTNHKYWN